jgi:hypothetical protein
MRLVPEGRAQILQLFFAFFGILSASHFTYVQLSVHFTTWPPEGRHLAQILEAWEALAMVAATSRTYANRTNANRTNASRTHRTLIGRIPGDENAAHGASSGPRHVNQILPDVLARYGITPEAMEQSAAAGRRARLAMGGAAAPALELAPVTAAFELAPAEASWATAIS